jgi:hypothetical protein
MSPKSMTMILVKTARGMVAITCAVMVGTGGATTFARVPLQDAPQTMSSQEDVAPIPPDQLDSLVAPIALYPDPLLSQTLVSSTYPLELMQLQQWLTRNPALKDNALADAVAKEPWDASVQSMAGLPDVVKRLTDDIQWTTDLGNAFLAQQSAVMEAVQRMRQKAKDTGNLKTTEQQVVETEVVESKSVIVIEQASPEVVYVPSYDPMVVYGAPVYPYPPIYYPPAGYYAAGMAVSFGVGVAMGAFWGSGGGWGWNAGWGHNDININRNNNFVRNTNVANRSGTWQHNAAHRGGAPYRDRATANRYGGAARGDSLAARQSGARQQINRQGGSFASDRAAGASNRAAGATNGAVGTSGTFNRSETGLSGTRGADRAGQRDLSRSGSNQNAFGGGSQKFSGSDARASSSRGSSSMQSRDRGSRSGSSMGSHGGGGGRSRGGGGSRGGGRR